MEALFLKIVNMSLTASWLVLAIVAVRFLFRKTPKWILCLLWGLVALRLIFPFSIESTVSMVPSAEPLPPEIIYTAHPEIQSGIPAVDAAVNPVLESSLTPVSPTVSANPTQIWSFIISQIWILGVAIMLCYTLVSYLMLKRRVSAAVPLEKGIKQCEYVDSPFVLGILRPVIYLPFHIDEKNLPYVIAHEKAHIRRRDHWWKPIGFLLLSIHWFNPVMWVAYVLLCRDIEAACDEKVIRDMDREELRAYSTALLNCSVHRRRIAACPLAFGETGVKARIKGIMNYKKPAFWVIVVAVVVCIIVAVCFLTDPEEGKASDLSIRAEDVTAEGLTVVYEPEGIAGDEQKAKSNLFYWLERYDDAAQSWEIVPKIGIFKQVLENNHDNTIAYQITEDPNCHILDWRVNYGYLTDGRYRVGITYEFPEDNETRDLYAEFTLTDVRSVYTWKNLFSDSDVYTTEMNNYLSVPGLKDIRTKIQFENTMLQDRIVYTYKSEGDSAVLISGDTIWNAFLTDLTGDGVAEICTTIDLDSAQFVQVYDFVTGQLHELKEEDSWYYLVERDDSLFVITDYRSEMSSGPLIFTDQLEIGVLEPDQQYLRETVESISITTNKIVTLSDPGHLVQLEKILADIIDRGAYVSQEVLAAAQKDIYHQYYITINYSIGEEQYVLSSDYDLLWEYGSETGYLIQEPEPLFEFIGAVTNGVRNRETSGSQFATMDSPYEWCAGITLEAVESAQAYATIHVRAGGKTVTGGVISEETLLDLIGILNQIPKASVTADQVLQKVSFYDVYRTSDQGIVISITDSVNGMCGFIGYQNNEVSLFLTDEMDKAERNSHTYFDPTVLWRIQDEELTAFLQRLFRYPDFITYPVGADYQWREPIHCEWGNYQMDLRLIDGWEYEQISEQAHSGIRCRPEGIKEGWIYFSFWPGGYEPVEENRYIMEHGNVEYPQFTSYPSDVYQPGYFSTVDRIWSYKKTVTKSGDYAVINDGADDWFLEYQDQISDTVTLANFTVIP